MSGRAAWANTPLGRHPHWADTPLGRHPPGQTPPWADTPWVDTPLGKHPPGQTPPWVDTPKTDTPPGQTPLGQTPPGQTPTWAIEFSNRVRGDPGFPRRGRVPTPRFGTKSYYLVRFLPKTAWKWKKLDRGRASLTPPWISQWECRTFDH